VIRGVEEAKPTTSLKGRYYCRLRRAIIQNESRSDYRCDQCSGSTMNDVNHPGLSGRMDWQTKFRSKSLPKTAIFWYKYANSSCAYEILSCHTPMTQNLIRMQKPLAHQQCHCRGKRQIDRILPKNRPETAKPDLFRLLLVRWCGRAHAWARRVH